jgi:hypothetical protein
MAGTLLWQLPYMGVWPLWPFKPLFPLMGSFYFFRQATEFDTTSIFSLKASGPSPLYKGIPTHNSWEFYIFRHKNFRNYQLIGNAH